MNPSFPHLFNLNLNPTGFPYGKITQPVESLFESWIPFLDIFWIPNPKTRFVYSLLINRGGVGWCDMTMTMIWRNLIFAHARRPFPLHRRFERRRQFARILFAGGVHLPCWWCRNLLIYCWYLTRITRSNQPGYGRWVNLADFVKTLFKLCI